MRFFIKKWIDFMLTNCWSLLHQHTDCCTILHLQPSCKPWKWKCRGHYYCQSQSKSYSWLNSLKRRCQTDDWHWVSWLCFVFFDLSINTWTILSTNWCYIFFEIDLYSKDLSYDCRSHLVVSANNNHSLLIVQDRFIVYKAVSNHSLGIHQNSNGSRSDKEVAQ